MAVGENVGVLVMLLLTFTHSAYTSKANQACRVECQKDVLIIITHFSGDVGPSFKALDATGDFTITEDNGAQCGYTYRVYPKWGVAILRASFFSCFTENKNDTSFTFNFHMTMMVNDEERAYDLTETCSISQPWFHQEITCEENYMEVSVQADFSCPKTAVKDGSVGSAYALAQETATSVWQLMFLKPEEEPVVLSLDEAGDMGYFLEVTSGRIVFRTPYGQPHSEVGLVNGLTVEVIRPAVFLRQRLTTMMVDLVAACSRTTDFFKDGAFIWRTLAVPTPLVSTHSGFRSEKIEIGVMGQCLDPDIVSERGYTVDVGPAIVEISIPIGAEGVFRKSSVVDNTYQELNAADLYYQHIFTMDDGALKCRLHQFEPMDSPILLNVPFTINLTVLEDRAFTVYVGNFPHDVELVSLSLNGEHMTVEEARENGYELSKVPFDNLTHAYTMHVPFEDPVVSKLYRVEGIREYSLGINYTLHIMPQEDEYFYFTTVVAQLMDVYPPFFNGLCLDSGIRFMLDHQEFDRLWQPYIGPFPLTQELADSRGYIMTNNRWNLTMDVPIFTPGYIYEDITLQHFLATFEILIRDTSSKELVQSSAKTCQFRPTELLVCDPKGIITVITDLRKAQPWAGASTTTLLDKTCTPKEVNDTRVLFEFSVNTCGTRAQSSGNSVIYENEIQFQPNLTPEKKPVITRDSAYRLVVSCAYSAHGVSRLFVDRKFQAQSPGVGSAKLLKESHLKSTQVTALVKNPSTAVPYEMKAVGGPPKSRPTVTKPPKMRATTTRTPLTRTTRKPQRPVKYVRVSSWSTNGNLNI